MTSIPAPAQHLRDLAHLRGVRDLQATGIDIVQAPTEQPYGLRDCAVRYPASHLIRVSELR